MTAKMEVFTAVLMTEVTARRLSKIATDVSRDRSIPTIFLGLQSPKIITTPKFQDVGITYIYQQTQRKCPEGFNL